MQKELTKSKLSFMIKNEVKNCKYLDDIIQALINVKSEYIRYCRPVLNRGKKNYYKYVERVFAYEFYHQYRLIMRRKKKKYEGLYLNGEQQKSSQVWKGLNRQTPDMVLHGKIDKPDYNGFTQKWLCEIKMCSNPNVTDDLKKIKNKSLRLKFDDYIFLFMGGNDAELKRKYNESELSVDDIYKDTICVCVEIVDEKNNDYNIICKRLKDII
ncbi:MAG: hypothetical protein J5797_10725 [Prevotella sp.]|nr:hypothetical protein [Prevotella sp.]